MPIALSFAHAYSRCPGRQGTLRVSGHGSKAPAGGPDYQSTLLPILKYAGDKKEHTHYGVFMIADKGGFPRALPSDGRFKALGIKVYTIRHSFCANLVRSGCPLEKVKEILGHFDFGTTLRYAHLAPDFLKGAMDRFNIPDPRESIPRLRAVV